MNTEALLREALQELVLAQERYWAKEPVGGDVQRNKAMAKARAALAHPPQEPALPAPRVPRIDIRPCALCHTNETGFVCTGRCEEWADRKTGDKT